MSLSGLLYTSSFFSIAIGFYTLYVSRKASKKNWRFFSFALCSWVWNFGGGLYADGISAAYSTLGIYLVECSLAFVFVLLTYYIKSISDPDRSFVTVAFVIQLIAAAAAFFVVIYGNFFTIDIVNGKPSMTFIRGWTYYSLSAFSVISPGISLVMMLYVYRVSIYQRNKNYCVYKIFYLVVAMIALQLRLHFPAVYIYGCFFEFAGILTFYSFVRHYDNRIFDIEKISEYVYSSVTTPFLVLDRKGIVQMANNSAGRFFGKAPGDLNGLDIRSLFEFEGIFEDFDKTRGERNSLNIYNAAARFSGVQCGIEASYTYDGFGELICVVFLIHDKTGELKLIDELEKAKVKAETANRAKSAFLANTSHEIRTPMNAITGMAELILREDISPAVYEHATGIKQAGANLLSIINDILDFSKIESGKLEILPVNFHLSSLINDVINIIRMRLMEKSLDFAVYVDAKLPNRLTGDEVRIRQILLNLLGNAIKYTESGFISLSIAGAINEKDKTVILKASVSDSGVGIKDSDKDKIFKDFTQVDVEKHKGIEGTGLGLVITKNLCETMGGNIFFTSEYGKGSTFFAAVPLKICEHRPCAKVENAGEKKVLVYETRSLYGNSIIRALEDLGIPCTLMGSKSDLYNGLRKTLFTHIIIPRILFDQAKHIIELMPVSPQLIITSDFGTIREDFPGALTLTSPVHSLSLANVLNGEPEGKGENNEPDIHFTAPEAKVLIVDDINTNLKVAKGLMSPYRMEIDTCTNGSDAIAMVQKKRYDIIFMDHMMPDMDGIEAAKLIRQMDSSDGYFRNVPIIALTANALSGVKEMFVRNSMDDFLAKPIEMFRLEAILGKWLPSWKQEKYTSQKEDKRTGAPEFFIEGVDVGSGISMTGGKLGEYITTLEVFCKDILEKIPELQKSLALQNIGLYTTHVHALKSASASIGAQKVSESAAVLENAGKSGDLTFINQYNPIFISALEVLAADIQAALPSLRIDDGSGTEDAPAAEAKAADMDVFASKLHRLKDELEAMNISAVNQVISSLQQEKWGKQVDQAIIAVSRQILLSDLDEAAQGIDLLLDSVKSPLIASG